MHCFIFFADKFYTNERVTWHQLNFGINWCTNYFLKIELSSKGKTALTLKFVETTLLNAFLWRCHLELSKLFYEWYSKKI